MTDEQIAVGGGQVSPRHHEKHIASTLDKEHAGFRSIDIIRHPVTGEEWHGEIVDLSAFLKESGAAVVFGSNGTILSKDYHEARKVIEEILEVVKDGIVTTAERNRVAVIAQDLMDDGAINGSFLPPKELELSAGPKGAIQYSGQPNPTSPDELLYN